LIYGLACIRYYRRQADSADAPAAAMIRRNTRRAAAVLIVNLPAAAVFAFIGILQVGRVTVTATIQNAGPATVDSFLLATPDGEFELGPLRPGQKAHRDIDASGGGNVSYKMTSAGATTQAAIRHWSDSDAALGDWIRLVVKDGKVQDQNLRW
jgi:hypothetical protein